MCCSRYIPNDFLDLGRVQGQTGNGAAKTSVGAGDIRVCAVIHIQHERVGALNQNLLRGIVLGCLHKSNGIHTMRRELFTPPLELLELVLDVVFEEVAETLLYPAARIRSFSSKRASLKISWMRIPLRAALEE